MSPGFGSLDPLASNLIVLPAILFAVDVVIMNDAVGGRFIMLAIVVPAAKFTFSPITESPTYVRCGIFVLSKITEFFISTACPTLQLFPIDVNPLI